MSDVPLRVHQDRFLEAFLSRTIVQRIAVLEEAWCGCLLTLVNFTSNSYETCCLSGGTSTGCLGKAMDVLLRVRQARSSAELLRIGDLPVKNLRERIAKFEEVQLLVSRVRLSVSQCECRECMHEWVARLHDPALYRRQPMPPFHTLCLYLYLSNYLSLFSDGQCLGFVSCRWSPLTAARNSGMCCASATN